MIENKKDKGTTVSGTMVVAHRAGIQVCLVVVVVIIVVVVVVVSICGWSQIRRMEEPQYPEPWLWLI